jgi:hypothetical protein
MCCLWLDIREDVKIASLRVWWPFMKRHDIFSPHKTALRCWSNRARAVVLLLDTRYSTSWFLHAMPSTASEQHQKDSGLVELLLHR